MNLMISPLDTLEVLAMIATDSVDVLAPSALGPLCYCQQNQLVHASTNNMYH